ncbi:hypothetical protein [Novipirellula rosea]|uniref:Colicin V production protein n=1 Tax=Novipirellula rosea TaxID=1031540 RepID=A0ABP8N961_9BACT
MNDSNLQSAQEAFASAMLPISLLVIVMVVGLFLVVGYSMKFALSVSGAGSVGFWKSIGVVIAATLAGSFVSAAIMFAMPGEPVAGLIAGVASIGTYVLVISAITHCSIGRGIAAYFLNGIFSGIGMIALIMILLLGVTIIRSTSDFGDIDFAQFKNEYANSRSDVAGEAFSEDSSGIDGDWDGFEVQQVSGQGIGYGYESSGGDDDMGLNPPQQLPSVVPASDSSHGLFDQFFTDKKSSPYPQPASKQCRSGCSSRRPTPPKSSDPVSTGIQANPFAN